MGFGGFHPFPRRFGGGQTRLEAITRSIQAQRGDAYSTDVNSLVYADSIAVARAISGAWATNRRVSLAWDPLRMPAELVPRWESILLLRPSLGDSMDRRRQRIALHFESTGVPTLPSVTLTRLAFELGSFFSSVERIGISVALQTVPGTGYPWGVVVSGAPWSSTTERVLVYMVQPAGATDEQFYAATSRVAAVLDPILPATFNFDWYRKPSGPYGVGFDVPNGPQQAGFYLDDTYNLDNVIFDDDIAPDDIEGLHFWLQSGYGVTQAGTVSAWQDRSANAWNVTQATAGSRPTYTATDAAYNNQPTVSFDGVNDGLSTDTSFTIPGAYTVFVVGQKLVASPTGYILEAAVGGVSKMYVYEQTGASFYHGNVQESASNITGSWFGSPSAPCTFRLEFGSTHLTHKVYENGVALPTVDVLSNDPGTAAQVGAQLGIGANRDASGSWLNAKIAEVIIYNRVLSAAETAQVETYLRRRFRHY